MLKHRALYPIVIQGNKMNSKDSISTPVKRKAHNVLNTEIFISRSKEKHGDRYGYSKSIYVNAKTKLIITCGVHGDFEQFPPHHLKGSGCSRCVGRGGSTKSLVARLVDARGDRYCYKDVIFEKSKEKVAINCNKHGLFMQNIWQHINGADCPKCCNERRNNKTKLKIKDLINVFNNVHNFKYDYSKSIYINIDHPIEIICPNHGSFMQAPYHHRRKGAGCPICTKVTPFSRSRYINACLRKNGLSSIYILRMSLGDEVFYKVGITNSTIKNRFRNNPYSITEIRFFTEDAGYIYDLETQIHRLLSAYHYKPKIKFGGSGMECFTEIPKEVLKIIDIINKSKQLQLLA